MATTVQRLREPTLGEMRDRLRFQHNIEVEDDAGGFTDVWADYAQLHGRVLPISARGTFIARQVESRATHQITIRYSGTSGQISRDDRVWMTDRNGERMFVVESVHDVGNNRKWTQVMAVEDEQESEV